MEIKAIALFCRSATFEFLNETICFQEKEYHVFVNDELKYTGKKNVFSLFGLKPNTRYSLKIKNSDDSCSFDFKTKEESFVVNILEFGAIGDGVFDNTQILQLAIQSVPLGGTLYFPEGVFLSGPLFLKSHTTLYLSKNAVLLGLTDRESYPILPSKLMHGPQEYIISSWEGTPAESYASLLTGIGVTDVTICGDGVIDCNAHNSDWWENHRVKRGAWRPKGIYLAHCENIYLQGIKVCNTPSWNQHPFFCKDVYYLDMFLTSPLKSPTTDGIDPESSEHIEIIGVTFCVGDDCIAIKSGKLEIGKKFKTPCKNIIIRNCYMYGGHAGLTLGSEMSGGVQDVKISQCRFKNLDRGIRLKSMRGRGKDGIIDGMYFSNIFMDNVKVPFVMNMFYKAGSQQYEEELYSRAPMPVTDLTPYFGEFTFEDMIAIDVEWQAGVFIGLPEAPIKKITLSNITIKIKEDAESGMPLMTDTNQIVKQQGFSFENVETILLEDVTMLGCEGEQIVTNNIGTIERR